MARTRPLKVIIDTNVVAYYLLATEPFVEEVRAFWHRPLDLAAPTLWEAEVSIVLWMAARTGLIDKPLALRRLGMAARLGIRSVPIRRLWRGALARALNSISLPTTRSSSSWPYANASHWSRSTPKLLAVFPDVAVRPNGLVAK